jgi:Ca2+-binding EF-hand superfamily protein
MDFNASESITKEMDSVPPSPWIDKMIADYRATGKIDMDALVRLLGEPTAQAILSDFVGSDLPALAK